MLFLRHHTFHRQQPNERGPDLIHKRCGGILIFTRGEKEESQDFIREDFAGLYVQPVREK